MIFNEDIYECYGSNLFFYVEGIIKNYYNVDCIVVRGKVEKKEVLFGVNVIINLVLLVEVLFFFIE